MKKMFSTVFLLLLTVSAATSVFAQKEKSKDELMKEIVTLSNTKKPEDADKAYVLAKEFLVRFPKDKNVERIHPFVKNYREQFLFPNAFSDKKYADFYTLGKEILTEQPENVGVMMYLGYGGYAAFTSGDKAYRDEALKYTQTALELMEKGTFPATFAPFNSKDDALAWMHFISGYFAFEKDSKAAASSLYKATLYETSLKKTPEPYLLIGQYYEQKNQKMTNELNAKAKTMSDADFKVEKAKIDVVGEQLMDVYARAYKAAEAANYPTKDQIKTQLKEFYKFFKKTDAGFDSYLTYVVTTPFKDPSTF
jgi:hypothetical protein